MNLGIRGHRNLNGKGLDGSGLNILHRVGMQDGVCCRCLGCSCTWKGVFRYFVSGYLRYGIRSLIWGIFWGILCCRRRIRGCITLYMGVTLKALYKCIDKRFQLQADLITKQTRSKEMQKKSFLRSFPSFDIQQMACVWERKQEKGGSRPRTKKKNTTSTQTLDVWLSPRNPNKNIRTPR